MKKEQHQQRRDTTLIQLLVLLGACFTMGICLFKVIGLHGAQNDLSFEQTSLIQEQTYLEQQIKALQNSLTQPSFLEIRMSVNKKQHKQKIHQSEHKHVEISKPTVDKKEYEYLELPNKLKVLLIRDPETKLTQAALNVNAGSWHEPDEFPGLAHFLEHMLFQGSHTYPETSYFEQLVAKGGGYTNAYTEGTRTNYYFTIDTSRTSEALNVFAHFFIDPLLSQEMVQKEANAVNSEYEINVAGDGWKILHLMSLMSDPKHPMSRFTIGNLQSLLKPHVVEALKKFHEQYYSSNQMALVIKSSQPIEMMKEFIESSEFLKIPNLQIEKPSLAHFGLPIKDVAKLIKYHINTRATTVIYFYQLEDSTKYFQTKPIQFINSIVRSRHDGGLYNYLISKNLIVDMDAQPFLGNNGCFQFYLIEVELSETLIGQQKDYALQIGQAIISYFEEQIHKFYDEEQNPTDFLEETYKTKKAMSDVQFKFLEKDIDIFKLSHNLNTFPPKYVLNAETSYFKYDPQCIYNYLADLMNPNNMLIMIGDDGYKLVQEEIESEELKASFLAFQQPSTLLLQQNAAISDIDFIKQSELQFSNDLYHIQYDVKQLDRDSLDFMMLDNIPLTLPQINHYVPVNLAFKSLCDQQHISYIQSVDSNTLYDRKNRQNIFIENTHKMPFYFTSKKECQEHEFEYEQYNHFPQLIKKDIEGKTWWRLDRSYSPTVYAGMNFETALDMKSLKKVALLTVFNSYVSDNLYKSLQQSFEAGYELSFDSSMKGLSLEMYGWSDKFEYFYKNVLREIKNEISDDDLLNRVKLSQITELSNSFEQKLFIQATSIILPTIIQGQPTPSQMIDEINSVTKDELAQFQKEMLENFRFTTYFTGNILRDEVQSLQNQIPKIFDESTSHIRIQNHITQVSDLSRKSIVYSLVSKSTNQLDTNGVTLNYYQIGYRDQKQLAMMNLLYKILHNAAYAYLRTQLQLGYVVSVKFKPVGCLDSAQILVQGTAKPPYVVNQHIEEFLINYGRELKEMTDQQFEELKTTTISGLKEVEKNLKEKARNTWSHIKNNDLAFEEKEIAAQYINMVTKQDLFSFYDKVFTSGKLSLQVYGQGMITQTMGISVNDLANKVKSNSLSKEQTFAVRDEVTVSTSDDFKQKITSNYNCNYKISNI
ncbi:unnamed protein product [Paramecium primaurelia]|uniref:Uncharacterized protein n=1 Tax=Paramecium primaurelia TaxID=5886 RepID=A0A8S1N321_PARPR|nr:unnamed protein product [Paramecium primaurelia]